MLDTRDTIDRPFFTDRANLPEATFEQEKQSEESFPFLAELA